MSEEDLKRLRRASLTLGLLVMTWTAAGILVSLPLELKPLGVPVIVGRPDLLPIGLALGAVYCSVRYYYYAHMLGTSPYRRRRDLLGQLQPVDGRQLGILSVYFGPTEFEAKYSFIKWTEVRAFEKDFVAAFPKFLGGRYASKVESRPSIDQSGEEYTSYDLHITLPKRSRQAAFLEDLDYSSPTWFPALAVALYLLGSPAA